MAAPAPFGVTDEPSPWAEAAAARIQTEPAGAPLPKPSRNRRGLAVGLLAGLVVLGGGSTVGLHAYAKHSVCAAFTADGGLTTGDQGTAGKTDLRDAAAQMRTTARLLLFDADLRAAVDGMADDAERLAKLQDAVNAKNATRELVGEMVLVAGSVNSHARQAQLACGLPPVGVFNS